MSGLASFISATEIPTSGIPREKFVVPSMGSTIQVYPSLATGTSSPSSPLKIDPGRNDRSSSFRNLSFSMSAEVTRFSLVPLSDTVKPTASLTFFPERLTMPSISDNTLRASVDNALKILSDTRIWFIR